MRSSWVGLGLLWAGPAAAAAAPRNIFVFVADGAGYNTFAAASMYEGRWDAAQQRSTGQVYDGPEWTRVGKACWSLSAGRDQPADEGRAYRSRAAWRAGGPPGAAPGKLDGYRFPHSHRAVQWHIDTHPDSAATMTQMMTGVKTYNGSINVGIDGQPLTSFAELAAEARGVGVVTSVPLSHATPAAAAGAHSASRRDYAAIAQEVLAADVVDVWMGAGHPLFDGDGQPTGSPRFRYVGGAVAWATLLEGQSPWAYVDTRAGFEALAAGEPASAARVLGLAPVAATLQVGRSGSGPENEPGELPLLDSVPSLSTMAQGAIAHLSAGHPGGFFLMVEGGAVDWAMHGNAAGHMIEEMIAFNEAIEDTVAWIEDNGGWEENLVIITADHDHLLQGVPTKRDPFPLVADRGAGKVPGHTWLWDNHSNHLVPVFARGAGAAQVRALADEQDQRRGAYLQDTEIFEVLLAAWHLEDPR